MTASNAAVSEGASVPSERRVRRPVTMHGFALREGGQSIDVRLLDLSYEGCGIETAAQLTPGEPLKLSVLRRGAIDCHVRWCADGKAGLVFDGAAEAERKQLPRKSQRVTLDAEVSLRRIGQNNYRVRLFDASAEGCRVELVERPRIGEQVLIKMPGLETLDAKICWVDEFVAGLSFDKPFHPAVVDRIVERARHRRMSRLKHSLASPR
jgi:hypothetical protein